jgi:ribosomal protein L37E
LSLGIYIKSVKDKLPVYRATEACKQCGFKKHVVEYSSEGWMPLGDTAIQTRVHYPHLHVKCSRCGYSWTRGPVSQEGK